MTLTWTDFSASGFSRTDMPLSAMLQFSSPLVESIPSWPEQQADITRKSKKTQKSLPPFGCDTEFVMGTEAVIEEAFIDVFCDLVYGGGWMDTEREDVDRECNWALVSFDSQYGTADRLTFNTLRPADRVQVTPAIKIHCVRGLRPTHRNHGLSLRGVCPTGISSTALCGCSE
jgi:hypothetical protein